MDLKSPFMPTSQPEATPLCLQSMDGDTLTLSFSGNWTIRTAPDDRAVRRDLHSLPENCRHLLLRDSGINEWDSTLVALVVHIHQIADHQQRSLSMDALPEGLRGLVALARAVPERKGARKSTTQGGFLTDVGNTCINFAMDTARFVSFTGESTHALARLLTRRAQFRWSDLWLFIQECGPMALPIVTLISILVGMILAFVGARQLAMFGAEIFIADAVGIGMAREMGAMMTAIIMAGRTGAAFAAQLGTMQVNQEVDALKTMGFSEIDFLVLPRMLALIIMMPLLTLYADFAGIVGGCLVATSLYDISVQQFVSEVTKMLHFSDFMVGLVKSSVFGILVAMAGCMRGIQCGRSSSAVGLAATSAVVSGILLIVVSDAIMTILTTVMGI